MRIGHFHSDLPMPGRKPGGVAVAVDRIATVQAERGHDVTVWSLDTPPVGRSYHHVQLGRHGDANHKIKRMFVVPFWLNRVDFGSVDILHLHGDDWFFVRRRGTTVRTMYGSAWYEAKFATSRRRQVSQLAHAGLELASSRLATATYGLGPGVPRAIRTIGNLDLGIDLGPTTDARGCHPHIAFIGTWDGRKRGRMLHRAFLEAVLPALPGARLTMVADFVEPAEGVTWLKAPSDETISALLRTANVFCLPSSYEGFGIPYLEAMAAGCAVVSTDNPGARHVFGPELASQIVDPADLGPELISLLCDGEHCAEVAARGRRRAEWFSWQRVAADLEAAYGDALARSGH